jgi:tellurite resistance protein TehA-like permease
MEKKDIIWIILISVILLVTVSLAIPVFVQNPPAVQDSGQNPSGHQQLTGSGHALSGLPLQQERPDQSKNLKTAISFINIGLIIPLFVIYAGIYRRVRSSFTLGLLAVIFALGMYAVTSCPLIVSLAGGKSGDIGLFQILPDLCTTIALVILIRISLE